MIYEVFMPALSSTMTEGKIVSWVKSPGDKLEKGETVLVVESDKADMDVETFYAGYLAKIVVSAGESAPVGATLALVAETEAEIELALQKATASSVSTTTTQEKSQSVTLATIVETPTANISSNGRTIVSPRAKKLAKELKVDLSQIKGTGAYGRIIAEDILAATGKTPVTVPQPVVEPVVNIPIPTPTPTPVVNIPTPQITPGQVVPFTTLQNAVVKNMLVSLSIPTFHVGYTITTDALDKLYQQLKSKAVTMTALLAKSVAVTLAKHPILNASYTENGTQYHSSINIAVAVAMDDGGLITPVLQNADQLDIYSLSRTWKDLVERARTKQLQPQEYSSGTFTISNLGMFGVDRFDAIVPPGQGGILAIGAARPQVVATNDGMIGVKKQMQVNLTADHRIIYGAHGAAFLQDLAKLIETNAQSLTM